MTPSPGFDNGLMKPDAAKAFGRARREGGFDQKGGYSMLYALYYIVPHHITLHYIVLYYVLLYYTLTYYIVLFLFTSASLCGSLIVAHAHA